MKILVVDDNIAIQEILKDILVDEGHNVNIAGTIDDAVAKIIDFKPDAILLDKMIDGNEGTIILTRVHEMDPKVELNAILIKNPNEETPRDSPFIKSVITKPFKSADITEALDAAKRKNNLTFEESKFKPKINLSALNKLKNSRSATTKKEASPKDDAAPVPSSSILPGVLDEFNGISFGTSYVVFEEEGKHIYDLLTHFKPQSYSVLVISSDNMKAVKQKAGTDNIDVVTLSSGRKGKNMDINALGTLTVYIKEYIHEHNNCVILFDDFNNIIDSNGFNRSLLFIHQLVRSKLESKTVSFGVSVDKSVLTVKDCNILLSDMREYTF